jgi:uroporphyrinogen decarboxylase
MTASKPELKNDRFLRALMGQPVDATPVWMMRQAGRYLPEYRALRAEAGDFLSLCKNADFACEVTLQPLRRYDLDAAADVAALKVPDMDADLGYVMNAVSTIRSALSGDVPLIGFSGSPWTLATYMIEGSSSKDFRHIKAMMYSTPELLHQVLSVLADSVIAYLNAQIAAGAQAVQIFDTWGGVLSGPCYQAFSLDYMQRIVNGLTREAEGRAVPVILFTKNGGQWLEQMAATGADALGLDWTIEVSQARDRVGDKVALQGNMDPSVLYADAPTIEAEVGRILADFGSNDGHVFNLGHGIHQFVDPESAKIFVDAVHDQSAQYHSLT